MDSTTRRTPARDRFYATGWDLVLVRDDLGLCWEWRGRPNSAGYGRITDDSGKLMFAHRMSYRLHRGVDPAGMYVCHRCDNPPCVNPDHLFLGTNRDNMADMVSKGRQMRGVRYGRARLTEADVREIRRLCGLGVVQRRIAEAFRIAPSVVTLIKQRKAWAHVE